MLESVEEQQFDSPMSLCIPYWLGNKVSSQLLQYAEVSLALAKQAGYEWLVGE